MLQTFHTCCSWRQDLLGSCSRSIVAVSRVLSAVSSQLFHRWRVEVGHMSRDPRPRVVDWSALLRTSKDVTPTGNSFSGTSTPRTSPGKLNVHQLPPIVVSLLISKPIFVFTSHVQQHCSCILFYWSPFVFYKLSRSADIWLKASTGCPKSMGPFTQLLN